MAFEWRPENGKRASIQTPGNREPPTEATVHCLPMETAKKAAGALGTPAPEDGREAKQAKMGNNETCYILNIVTTRLSLEIKHDFNGTCT